MRRHAFECQPCLISRRIDTDRPALGIPACDSPDRIVPRRSSTGTEPGLLQQLTSDNGNSLTLQPDAIALQLHPDMPAAR
jgi:hypothetical protein